MRRLLFLVSALVLVDTMLYAALTPLLPRFAHELHLSKAGAGVLVAAYAAGALLGGLPGGRAAVVLGPRRAVLAGLVLMGASSIGFALAHSYSTLITARVIQGAGSAFTWAGAFTWLLGSAPRTRRGELIGRALGAAVFGELLGPIVGTIAGVVGREAVFLVLAGLALVLGVLTVQIRADATPESSEVPLREAFGQRRFAGGLALLAVASLLFGVLSVLAPLHLAAAGWDTSAIGAMWLVGAACEACQSPFIGRLIDRRGPMTPVRAGLLASALVSLALATGAGPAIYAPLVLAASMAFGSLFAPSFALISEGADRARLAQGMAFGLMNAAWAVGAVAGPAGGGAIARATGDLLPFALIAAVCLATFVLARWAARAPRARPLAGSPSGGKPL